jgi:crossover junction endodeoxyribonuclease RuvC
MTAAVGLDLSLTSTGVALASGQTRTIRTSIPANATATQRAQRLDNILRRLEPMLRHGQPVVAMLEGYAGFQQGNTAARLGELHGPVMVRCVQLGMAVYEVAPSTLKKYATGDGRADKLAMVAAAQSLGYRPVNDDEADAALLRHMAVHYAQLKAKDFEQEATPSEWAAYQFDVLLGLAPGWPA